jgi:hypothetical protein
VADGTRLEDLIEIEEGDAAPEYVPYKSGRIRADRPVVLSFRVTAKERYLWSLAVAKRGTTMSDVLRTAFGALLEEEQDGVGGA